MSLPSFEQLHEQADALRQPVAVVAAGGADRTVLEALRAACDRGWVTPAVTGREADVRRLAEAAGIDLHGFTLVDADEPAAAAVERVRRGEARLLMKGQIATPALMRAMLDPAHGLRTGRVICQVVLMSVLPARRQFLLADTGVCVRPTLEQKADILRSAVGVAHALGAELPRVAVMAASESPSPAMPDTLEAAELQRRCEAGEFPGCVVQGPLSFDLAYAADAADKKRVGGPVPGAADMMLFPDLAAANLTVKAIMYTADCRFGGVLCGAACPVVFMSRADTTATRLNSLALALRLTGPATPA
ncbi:MAG TPA: phosphate acyltransferase [Gemmataceae bacterium]|nr:phosphate acyltransferase [Gemmataceae bacterium]